MRTARSTAANIAGSIFNDCVVGRTTVAIERATLTLMGVDGAKFYVPHTKAIVDAAMREGKEKLSGGIFRPFVNAMIAKGFEDVQMFADSLVSGENVSDVTAVPSQDEAKVLALMDRITSDAMSRLDGAIALRAKNRSELGVGEPPLLYLIVATGEIKDDARQARVVAREGADVIAVIRHSGQSLLDHFPVGMIGGGEGGTYATRANMRHLREELDDVGLELGRYIQQTNYASGMAMPEVAAVAVQERLDMLLCDSMYGILFRDINPYRTFLDQHYSRMLCAYAGITINTGEDNYLTNADAVAFAHTVYASNFMNEQLALLAHLPPYLMGLGHAYEIDPKVENHYLLQLSEALLSRQLFPDHPLKYMPPTKHIGADMLFAHVHNVGFNKVAWLTAQTILLLGIMSEGVRTPHLEERLDSIRSARLAFNGAHDEGSVIRTDGTILETRAQEVLANTVRFLAEVERDGILPSIEAGKFAEMRRSLTGGHGYDGVITRSASYENPIFATIEERLIK
ncbi:D-lysine 5,6-aminomutase subunit alpha [Candidatus Saganbacteria bacterium]|nr:D-lysine 5,6-aminomutase subunit alpha [Candidatus Saganbacteria bacterium]